MLVFDRNMLTKVKMPNIINAFLSPVMNLLCRVCSLLGEFSIVCFCDLQFAEVQDEWKSHKQILENSSSLKGGGDAILKREESFHPSPHFCVMVHKYLQCQTYIEP